MPGQYMTETVCARALRVLAKVRVEDDDDALDTLSWEFDEVARLVAKEASEDAEPGYARKVAALESELAAARSEVERVTEEKVSALSDAWGARRDRDEQRARAEKAERERDDARLERDGARLNLAIASKSCEELDRGITRAIVDRDIAVRQRDEARAELVKAKKGGGR